ncbi:hypothetical protein [Pontimicrobium sp. IMCC45349]|uniref:hypothetical protein n=1 Tax=Pontimicrobium sp. IMCC45349 TaxID=3391574 RepID=UPI0039A16A0C
MVVLKKVKASTLTETLVATVLIMIVFMVSSIVLNNVFTNTIKYNTNTINSHLDELEYLCNNNKIILPYKNTFHNWDVSVVKIKENNKEVIIITGDNKETDRTVEKVINDNY